MHNNTIIRSVAAGSIFALLSIVFGACHKTQAVPGTRSTGGSTVVELLEGSFNVSLFNEAIHYTGLDDSMKTGGPYTVFAPDDAAFNMIGISRLTQIDSMNKDTLTHLLKYHILDGQSITRLGVDSKPNNPFVDWDGKTLYLSRPYSGDAVNDDNFTVNGDTVLQADILATNGVVHTLNTVLKYQNYNTVADYLNADTTFSIFVTALHKFGLYDMVGQTATPITVCAPINSAFLEVGIDADSINRMDTTQISSLLFRIYLMPNLRYYSAPRYNNYGLDYYSPDGTYQVAEEGYYDASFNYYIGEDGFAFDPATHAPIQLFSTIDGCAALPIYGEPYSQAMIISQDNPAGNGVVIVINETLAGPDACRRLH